MAGFKLIDLVRKFDAGQIQLPLMQRDYVWPPRKVVDLLDSLRRGWPIGVFYIWETTHAQPVKEPALVHQPGEKLTGEFLGYLLDGQQRLTSLCRALDDKQADSIESRAFFDVRKQVFVMGKKTRTIEKRFANDDPTLIPLCKLIPEDMETLQGIIASLIDAQVIQDTTRDRAEYQRRLTDVARMFDKVPPVEFFKTGDSDQELLDAIELFKRLNKGGKPLSRGDTEAATLTQRATAHVVPKMRAFVHGDEQMRLGLNFVLVTRALIANHNDNPRFSELPTNWAMLKPDINKVWEATERGLARVVSYLRDHLGWTSRRWLPSANALVPLSYLLRDRKEGFYSSEYKAVCQYLCLAGVRSSFRGAVETAIERFMRPVKRAPNKAQCRATALVRVVRKTRPRRITAQEIVNERRMHSPLMQAYLAYLVSRDAKTWLESATLLEVAKRHIDDPLAIHHIFPRKLLRDNQIEPERINCMANYAVLSQSDNATIGDKDPKGVYEAMSGTEKDNADKQLFGILAENRDWLESYDAFLAMRSERLAKELNEFIGLD